MDLLIASERLELAEAVRDFFSGKHGPEVLRRLDAQDNRDPTIWQSVVEMGLPGLLVPEEHGGLGMGLVDAVLIARECGRACLAEPLVESAFVMVPWLIEQGDQSELSAIATGETRPVPQHKVNGWVADGDGAAFDSVDPLRNLSALPDNASDDPHLLNLGALMASAQLVGLAEAMLDQAVEYSKVREQFGQPVGGFQAIKHKLADVAVALEFARPVLWRAAQALEDDPVSASLHVSHAKIVASDSAYLSGESAIQVHGAMGYTYEVDLHFWIKRAWALSGAWGSRGFHSRRVDDAIIGGDQMIGPQHTFT